MENENYRNDREVYGQGQYNAPYGAKICPVCGMTSAPNAKICLKCGNKLNNQNSQLKIVMIVLAGVIALLLAIIVGLFAYRVISGNIGGLFGGQIESVQQTIDEKLYEARRRYDDGDYTGARNKLYSIDVDDMNDDQKSEYNALKADIDNQLNGDSDTVYHAGDTPDYSSYENSLTVAYVSGAETGNVYFWVASSGDSYTTIISNGTMIYTTGHTSNGRTLVKCNGKYGWLTSKYISYSNNSYQPGYYVGGAETGSVYVWEASYGNSYITTIPNGTSISPTGYYENGRTEIRWGNRYAWVTSKYVR